MEIARRGIRFGRRLWRSARSFLLLSWYRLQFGGFEAGRNVTLGKGVDINLVRGASLRIGSDVVIEDHVHITVEGKLKIGRDSFIGHGCVLVAVERIVIGNDALIAAYVTLRDQNHGYADPALPYRAQASTTAPIELGDNVWLGTHVTVLKGVRIGADAIVGANSVVSRDLPEAVLAAGAPARIIRSILRSAAAVEGG